MGPYGARTRKAIAIAVCVCVSVCLILYLFRATQRERFGDGKALANPVRDRPHAALFAETREGFSDRRGRPEGFSDRGPLAPVTLKPCEVYYTPDEGRCNDGSFDTARAAYAASLAAIEGAGPPDAKDRVRAAALRTAIAEIDALPGPTGACRITLPDPWRRAVTDPDDTMHDNFPGAMHCFVPVGDVTDYAALAASGAGVAETRDQGDAFKFHGTDAPDAPAADAWRRFEFTALQQKGLADGFYCRLPSVVAGRASDPRYDVGRGTWSTQVTFGVRAAAAPDGTAAFTLLTASVDGDLLEVMRQFYDESCPDDGSVARLMWTPHLEAGALVLRTQEDACRKLFVTKTYDDKCKVGRPVVLKTYSMQPQPEVFGTTTAIQTTKANAIASRAARQKELDDRRALLVRQKARYDTVVDVLRLMLDAWDLALAEYTADAIDDALVVRPQAVFAQVADRRPRYTETPKPSTTYPERIEDDDGALYSGLQPLDSRMVPALPAPRFAVYSANIGKATVDFHKNLIFSGVKVQCPDGSYVTGVSLVDAGQPKGVRLYEPVYVRPILTCYNPTSGKTSTVDPGTSEVGNAFVVPSPYIVEIFTDRNFWGSSIKLKGGRYDQPFFESLGFNDQISSIQFLNSGKVTLFEHGSFNGNWQEYTTDVVNLRDKGFNDMMSSMIVE